MKFLPVKRPRGVPLYVAPELLIAFAPTDPEFAAYEARMLAPGNVRRYSNVAGNTLPALKAILDARTDPTRAVHFNIEVPWNAVLGRTDAQGVDEAWRENASVIAEFTRQAYPVDISVATLDDFRQVGITLRQEATAYARSLGASRITTFDGGLIPPINSDGTVASGVSVTGTPLTERTWWTSTGATLIGDRATTRAADGSQKSKRLSQLLDDAYGMTSYKFYADLPAIWSNVAEWSKANATRRTAGGTGTESPDFDRDDYLFWIGRLSARDTYEMRRCFDLMVGTGDMTLAASRKAIAHIVLPDGLTPDIAVFPSVHPGVGFGWFGPDCKTIGQVVSEIAGLWGAASADAPNVLPPQEVWLWHDVRTFWRNYPRLSTASESALTTIARAARNAIEMWAFGRSRTAGFPWNTTTDATYRDYTAANNLGDTYWNSDAADWWTVADGSQIGPDCTLDETSPIAEWLDFSADIARPEVDTAIKHALSERMTQIVEQAATALARLSPGRLFI